MYTSCGESPGIVPAVPATIAMHSMLWLGYKPAWMHDGILQHRFKDRNSS